MARVRSNPDAAFDYEAPTVTSVLPKRGSGAGGARIEISGSGFAPGKGNTVFMFGENAALSVNCSSTVECRMVAPAAAGAGVVDVRATAGGKTSPVARPGDLYTY